MTTTIYDGQCVICQMSRRVISLLDWFGRVEWLDLHDRETVSRRYPWLDHAQAMGEIHVVDSETDVYAGYYGVRRLLREVPLGLPVWAVLSIPGMDRWGRRAYGWVARNRYAINRFVGVDLEPCEDGVCKIPSAE